MKNSSWRCVLAAFSISHFSVASAAEGAGRGIDSSLIVEEFDLVKDGDDLTLPVTVFGRTRSFVLDTGSSWMLFDKSLRRFLGSPARTVRGSTPSGRMSVELFECPRAKVGSICLNTDSLAACQDLRQVNHDSPPPFEGLIGATALKHLIVRLDSDAGKLMFLKAVPGNAGKPLHLSRWHDVPTVQVEIEGYGREEFIIDTGAAAVVGWLDADLAVELGAKNVASVSKTDTITSVDLSGSSAQHKSLCLKGLRLGPHRLKHVPMYDKRAGAPSILGMGLWSRFNVTIDFPHNLLYLEKSKHFDRPL